MTSLTLSRLLPFPRERSISCLTEEQQELLPNSEEINFFREHGWFKTQKVISEALIDRIFAASEELYNGDREAELPNGGCSKWKRADRSAVRNNEYISFQKQAFRQLSLQPIIGAIAARLMDADTVRYFQDQLVSKEPNHTDSTKVGWHTDRSYHSNCTSDKLLTVWIPLHDVSEEHGSLVMVDRSHRWAKTDHMRGFNQDNHQEIKNSFRQQGKDFTEIPIALKKGQISFHCSTLVHGSYQNRSNMLRRAIVLNVQDGDNRYRPFWNNGRQIHHYLDRFCRQQKNCFPDYTDPAIFPVIWSEDQLSRCN